MTDDISYSGKKYKALRDFVTVSIAVSRERNLYMVVRITGLTYK